MLYEVITHVGARARVDAERPGARILTPQPDRHGVPGLVVEAAADLHSYNFV